MTDHRAHLDFEITFANGGGLRGEGFRIDLPSAELDEAAIGELLVRHLGLALVRDVRLDSLEIVEEAHRGSRHIPSPGRGSATIVDLSHRIRAGMVTYPGLPGPAIEPHLSREDSRDRYAVGTEFEIDRIDMVGNTGTYLDSPFHRYADGADLADVPLERTVDLRAEVFHLEDAWDADHRGIDALTLADRDLRGAAVLLHTGWSRHFGTDAYGIDAPFLTESGVDHLVRAGAALVGIDSVNIDDIEKSGGGARPAHSLLLAVGIPIVEHLTRLDQVPARGARFFAVPPAVEGLGTVTVRAIAIVGS